MNQGGLKNEVVGNDKRREDGWLGYGRWIVPGQECF